MPFADLPNARIRYEFLAADNRPVLILSNSLGTNLSMWDPQAAPFASRFRLLRYDMRGHGQSSVPPPPYTIADLASDLLSLVDFLGIERFHFCGLSIGGQIGIGIALKSPERLDKLVLSSTAAKIGTLESWNSRIATVLHQGMKEIATATPLRWFTPAFQSASPQLVAATVSMVETTDPQGYVGGCCAVRDFEAHSELGKVRNPTLVLSGAQDPATPPGDGRFLAERIPGARFAELRGAHMVNIEDSERFTGEVLRFLDT
jgi:3-oxoadipate enol-lactonase